MAAVTGAIGGVIVFFSCLFIEKIGIDDPVGAVSVHGICGAWGTLAIGILSSEASMSQLAFRPSASEQVLPGPSRSAYYLLSDQSHNRFASH